MKISLDYYTQWKHSHCWDLFSVGVYRGFSDPPRYYYALCFTLFGLVLDIEFNSTETIK